MKKLFLSFILLAFSSIQAFEYNPIQQAIVDRDPDALVKILATTTLSYAEKKTYIDLAEQVIWDNYLPFEKQVFPKKSVLCGKDALYLLAAASICGISIGCASDLNPLDKSFDLKLSLCISTILGSGSFFAVYLIGMICKETINFSKSSENAVKVKQILLAA